jgi:hypothetical protein
MPLMPVSHYTWQLLRALKRSKRPLTGMELRVSPSRTTKDGTFLDRLVAEGLLKAVGVDPLPEGASGAEARRPVQFRTRYRLTEKGEHAAEFGEYEREARTSPPAGRSRRRAAGG